MGQNYYPEIMHEMFIINCPLMFRACYKMFKPFINEKTRNKIHIRGGKFPDLFEKVDKGTVPSIVGGDCECPGEDGCNLSDIGPWQEFPGDGVGEYYKEQLRLEEECPENQGDTKPVSPEEEHYEADQMRGDNSPALPLAKAEEEIARGERKPDIENDVANVKTEAAEVEAEAHALANDVYAQEAQMAELESQLKNLLPVTLPKHKKPPTNDSEELASKLQFLAEK
jgi:hypothetical protein